MLTKLTQARAFLCIQRIPSTSQAKFHFSTQQTPIPQSYRHILVQLNLPTLKNELVYMKNLGKRQADKHKKIQIIEELCLMEPAIIERRLVQLKNKTIFQIENTKGFSLVSREGLKIGQNQKKQDQVQDEQKETSKITDESQPPQKKPQQSFVFRTNHPNSQKSNQAILVQSLRQMLPQNLHKIMHLQTISYERIMNALYDNYVKKEDKKLQKSESPGFSLQDKQATQSYHHYSNPPPTPEQQQQHLSTLASTKRLSPFSHKPLANRLFKTNEQIFIEQQKRKYLYQYQKQQIIHQITQPQPSSLKEFIKNMKQIRLERLENSTMKGFYLDYSNKKGKEIFQKRKDTVMYLFCGFNYFKQLCTSPHLVQFIFALMFDKDLPVEYTMLKIAEECQQQPETFKHNLMSISSGHFLKFLRTSANYLLKVFQRADNINASGNMTKKEEDSKLGRHQQADDEQENDEDEDDYDLDDDDQFKEVKSSRKQKKQPEQQQKFPKSRQFIDMELMRFAFALFEAGIERVVREITLNKSTYLSPLDSSQSDLNKTTTNKTQQKQLKALHQTLMLCFDIYKTMQALFVSIQINDFKDLDRLMQILLKYHTLRIYLLKQIGQLQHFLRKYDRQYQQKLQLGLSNIITEHQLSPKTFILKNQARKLNFEILDNIMSMLKTDNIEITLENKRDLTLKVLERFLKVYLDNGMVDFLQEELVYAMVRFLEKEVYLDRKIKELFEGRVNFGGNGEEGTDGQGIEEKGVNQRGQIEPQLQTQDQYFQQQASKYSSASQFQWFQPRHQPSSSSSSFPSSTPSLTFKFNPFSQSKQQKTQYFTGHISPLLSKQLLFSLITIIKYKHERKELGVQHVHGFNLIQEWYSEPEVVRLQFLKEEIVGRYKGIVDGEEREREVYVRRMQGDRKGDAGVRLKRKVDFVV